MHNKSTKKPNACPLYLCCSIQEAETALLVCAVTALGLALRNAVLNNEGCTTKESNTPKGSTSGTVWILMKGQRAEVKGFGKV